MKVIKVKDLLKDCQALVKKCMGDKDVYIPKDDEENGYHPLFYSFTTDKKEMEDADWNGCIEDYDNAVILG